MNVEATRHSSVVVLWCAVAATAHAGCGGSVAIGLQTSDSGTSSGSARGTGSGGSDDGGASSGAGGSGTATSGDGGAPESRCGSTMRQLVDFGAAAAQANAVSISGGTPLAVDSASLYFVMGNKLMRVPIEGGALSIMATLPDTAPNFSDDVLPFVVSTDIFLHYNVASGNDEVVRVPLAGGSPTVLASSSGSILAFGVGGANLYFVDQDGLKSLSTSGGAVRLLTSQIASMASGLAVIGSAVVVTEYAGTVVAVPLQGGPQTALATGQPNANFPMPCGSDICWWAGPTPQGEVGATGPGEIVRLASNGNTTSLPGVQAFPASIAFDGSSFFEAVACDCAAGPLMRIPLSGTPVMMTFAGFVAVDDECVYFSSLQTYPVADGGPASGIFSVSKRLVACFDSAGEYVYSTTGSCTAATHAGSN